MKPMKIKKWLVLFFAGLFPTLATILYFSMTRKLVDSLGLGFGIIILFVVIGSMVLKNPFMRIFEESEYLLLTISSSGGIIPFTLIPMGNKVLGNINGRVLEHVYDRNAMVYLDHPRTGKFYQDEENVYLVLPKKDLNQTQFSMSGIPSYLWNEPLGTFLTKEMLSTMETKTFARHEILYLNHQAKDLNSHMLNFGRYVIDQTKPAWKIWEQGWFKWILIILLIVGMAYFLAPTLLGGGQQLIASGSKAAAPVVTTLK